MRFKLDENFGGRIKSLFVKEGYDTFIEQELGGADDKTIYEICCNEKRCLVSLDLDFSDVIRFPPEECGGIVILRSPSSLTFGIVTFLTQQFLKAIKNEQIAGKLWIVEPNRIRMHQSEK